MGLLDMLFGAQGATPAAQAAPQMPVPGNTWGSDQPPPSASPAAASAAPPVSQDVNVTAQRQPKGRPGGGYNNLDDLNALHGVQDQYAAADKGHTNGSGLGLSNMIPDSMPGAGTLRNILGTLGDAFLIQSGHQPIHAQQHYNQQIADAAAGFDTDPGAAAARIAATGAPGSMQEAQGMYQADQNNKMRQATMENTNAYRQGILSDREQNHQATQAIQQGKEDDRTRSLNGGIVAAAAATGDPKKYAGARAAAIARIKPGSTIDPSEYPEDMNDFNSAYGLNANQYARNVTSNASIGERANASAARNKVTMRGQDMGAANNNARVQATYAGQAAAGTRQDKAIAAKAAGGGGLHLPPGLMPNQGTSAGGAPIGSNLAPPHPSGTISPSVPQAAVQMLRSNPGLRAQFEAKYGRGSAAQILGH